MKKLVLGLFLLLSTMGMVKADHILGGDITYTHLKDLKYQVKVTIFRDCGECMLDGRGGGGNGKDCGGFDLFLYTSESSDCGRSLVTKVDLTKVTFQSILNTCPGVRSQCSSVPNFGYGIEAHYFLGEVDFSDYKEFNNCGMELFVQMSLRKSDLTNVSGTNTFCTYSYINPWIAHNSPQFNNRPSLLLNCNRTFSESVLESFSADDSIEVKMGIPVKSRSDKLTYNVGYGKDRPLKVYCNGSETCPADPTTSPATGFYINSSTGQVVFTPVNCSEKAVVAYDVTKWIQDTNGKWIIVSMVRRDVQYTVDKISGNNPPVISSKVPDVLSSCVGTSNSITISATDARTQTPNGPAPSDTVRFKILGSVPGLSYKLVETDNAPFYELSLTWSPTVSNLNEDRYIVVRAYDNACPLNAYDEQIIKLETKANPDLLSNVRLLDCGNIEITDLGSSKGNWKYMVVNLDKKTALSGTERNDTVVIPEEGVQNIRITLTSSDNCISAADTTITISRDDILKDYIPSELTSYEGCSADSIKLSAKSKEEDPILIQWLVNGLPVSQDQNWVLAPDQIRKTDVVELYIAHNENGLTCFDREKIDITINRSPEIDVWTEKNICYGAPDLNLNDGVSPQGGEWFQKTGTNDWEKVENNVFVTTDWEFKHFDITYKMKYVVTDQLTGCSAEAPAVIQLRRVPQMELKDVEMCAASGKVSLKLFVTRPFLYETGNYTWLGDPGLDKFITDDIGDWLIIPDNTTGQFRLIATNTTQYGCTNKDTGYITLLDEAHIDLGDPGILCQSNEELSLSELTRVNLESGVWFSNTNPEWVIDGNLSPDACGKVEVTYIIDQYGCYDSKSLELDIRCKPKFKTDLPDTVCKNLENLHLNAEPVGGQWSGQGVQFRDLDLKQVSGDLQLTYTIKDGLCSFIEDVQLYVAESPVLTIAEYPQKICEGELIRVDGIHAENCDFEVSSGGGILYPEPGGFTYKPSPAETSLGVAHFDFHIEGIGVCNNIDSRISTKINPNPSIRFTAEKYRGCEPFELKLNAVSTNPNVDLSDVTFQWNFGDPLSGNDNFSTKANPTHTYLRSGVYDITVNTQHTLGCKARASMDGVITVSESPQADFTMDPDGIVSTLEPKVSFINNSIGSNLTYKWDFGNNNFRSSINPTFSFSSDTGNYPVTLTVTNEFGCSRSVTKNVYVAPDIQIFIPNAFTPNGKGPPESETFGVRGLNIKDLHAVIYNRWGQVVGEFHGPTGEWDGTNNGVPSLPGVYLYEIKVVSVTGHVYEYQGTLTLIR